MNHLHLPMVNKELRDLLSLLTTELNMKDNGMRWDAKMVKESKFGLMDLCTRDTGKLIKQMEEED